MSRRTKPALPGLSRSSLCVKTKSCGRLDGHKAACRPTLTSGTVTKSPAIVFQEDVMGFRITVRADGTATSVPAPVKAGSRIIATRVLTEGAVEVASADRYTVQPERTVRQARRPKVQQCRISRNNVRCSRALGHKQAGKRHAFTGLVRVVAEATTPDRTQTVRTKHARTRGYVTSNRPSSRLA